MAFLYGEQNVLALQAAGDLLGDAQLVTFDAENVITGAGDPQLRDGAMEMLEGVQAQYVLVDDSRDAARRHVAVATNNANPAFVNGLEEQLPSHIKVVSGLEFASKKKSPEMFLALAGLYNVAPRRCVHVDDQWLSMRGARMAGYSRGVLVSDYGITEHRGVRIFRPVDRIALRLAIARQTLAELPRMADY